MTDEELKVLEDRLEELGLKPISKLFYEKALRMAGLAEHAADRELRIRSLEAQVRTLQESVIVLQNPGRFGR